MHLLNLVLPALSNAYGVDRVNDAAESTRRNKAPRRREVIAGKGSPCCHVTRLCPGVVAEIELKKDEPK
jgi:hypothetical protein